MKKVKFVLSILVIAMSVMVCNPVMAQTRKEKKAAAKAEWEFQQKKKEMERQRVLDSIANANKRPTATTSPAGTTFDIPCMGASKSDKEYYRQLGIGEDMDLSVAQSNALQNAQSLMYDRLGGEVKGLATDYSKKYSKSGSGDSKRGLIEREFTKVVNEVLQNADNACEQAAQLPTGAYRFYYVVEIKKGKLVEEMTKAIDKNDELRTDFDRDQFRKYASEYLQKQEDFQNNQQ